MKRLAGFLAVACFAIVIHPVDAERTSPRPAGDPITPEMRQSLEQIRKIHAGMDQGTIDAAVEALYRDISRYDPKVFIPLAVPHLLRLARRDTQTCILLRRALANHWMEPEFTRACLVQAGDTPEPHIRALMKALDDPDAKVRIRAARALGASKASRQEGKGSEPSGKARDADKEKDDRQSADDTKKQKKQPLKFDEVSLVKGHGPDISLLYVVLTEPTADNEKRVALVVQYAKLALREAAARKFKGATTAGEKHLYEGNVVFLIRQDRIDRRGQMSGFSVGQLRAIAEAKSDQARLLVAAHAWGLGKLPENDLEEGKQLVIEIEQISRLQPPEQKKKVERIYRRLLPRLAEIDGFGLPGGLDYEPNYAERAKLPAQEWVERAWQKHEMTSMYLIRNAHQTCHEILAKHPDAIKPLLLADFASKEPTDVKRALRVVGNIREGAYFDQVLAVFEGKNAALSDLASYTLRDLNDPRAIPYLVKRSPRLDGYEQLRSLQTGRKAHPDLVACLESPDATVRWHAAYALAESGDPALVPHVIRLCADASALVRENAANMGFCLKNAAYAKVHPTLVKLLHDPDANVRKFTAVWFAQLQDKACAKTLFDLIQDTKRTNQERYDVVRSIKELTGTDFGYNYDPWDPTTPANQAAIRRFAEWVKKNAPP